MEEGKAEPQSWVWREWGGQSIGFLQDPVMLEPPESGGLQQRDLIGLHCGAGCRGEGGAGASVQATAKAQEQHWVSIGMGGKEEPGLVRKDPPKHHHP